MPGGRCLVLNASFEFLHVTNTWFDSLRLLRRGKVTSVKNYPVPARAEREKVLIPAVAVLKSFVSTPHKKSHFNLPSHRNILIRDGFQCAYCPRKLTLGSVTKDHVIPRSKGGLDVLTNVVAACRHCNTRKADKTPAEAGMTLRVQPRALNEAEKLEILVKVHKAPERALWKEALDELKVKLF
jgi:5-methylcytosine-specific restriction endonuclease McrA